MICIPKAILHVIHKKIYLSGRSHRNSSNRDVSYHGSITLRRETWRCGYRWNLWFYKWNGQWQPPKHTKTIYAAGSHCLTNRSIHRNTCTLTCDDLWWPVCARLEIRIRFVDGVVGQVHHHFRPGRDRDGMRWMLSPGEARASWKIVLLLNDTYLMGQQSKPKDVGCFGTF